MLGVILTILKILGIVLLSLLGLILLVLLIILFVPITYKGKAEYLKKLKATGKVTWLLGLVKFVIELEGKNRKAVLYLFGIKVKDNLIDTSKEKQPVKREVSKKPKDKDKKKKNGSSGKLQKVREKISEGELFEQLSVLTKELGHVIRHILPKDLHGRILYGFDDPSVTGMILSVVAAIIPPDREKLLIETNFTEKCFEMDIAFSDRIFIIYLLICVLRVVLNEHFRSIFFSSSVEEPVSKEVTNV